MLIKGKKSTPSPMPSPEAGQPQPASENSNERTIPQQPSWTPENLESGIVPDRRKTQRQDRRRGYRRIEERELISKAVEEAQAIREQARHEGFEEGLNESRAITAHLKEAIEKLLNAREDALHSAADDIGGLAVEIAERIIKTEVMCDSSFVLTLVHDTIQKAGRQSKTILVKVHPDDVAVVKQSLKEDPIPNMKAELIVMEDRTVDQGSCIVETNSGLVDASFSTQLGILKQLLGISDTSKPS